MSLNGNAAVPSQEKNDPSSKLSNETSTRDHTPIVTYTPSNEESSPQAAECKAPPPPRSLSNFDAASTIAPSTHGGYAPSSINNDERSLLSHSGGHRQQRLPKTTSRKAYEGVCHALEIWVPLDINEETTSMRDSSLLKLATGRRRSRSVKQDSGGPSRDRQGNVDTRTLQYGLPETEGGRR